MKLRSIFKIFKKFNKKRDKEYLEFMESMQQMLCFTFGLSKEELNQKINGKKIKQKRFIMSTKKTRLQKEKTLKLVIDIQKNIILSLIQKIVENNVIIDETLVQAIEQTNMRKFTPEIYKKLTGKE